MSSRVLLVSILASKALANCAYGTTLHPRAEGEVKVGNFGYNGVYGPTNWQNLNAANTQCALGTRQSPIDMVAGGFPKIAGTAINLRIPNIDETDFENLGTTVEVIANQGGTMTIPSVGDFKLQQFHFHLPSEHLDNGTSQAMEMHMVWEGVTDPTSVAVISAYIGLVDQNNGGDLSAGTSKAANVAGAVLPARKRQSHRNSARDNANIHFRHEGASTKAEVPATEQPAATSASGATTALETVLNTVDKIATPGTSIKTPAVSMSEIVDILTAGEFQQYTGSLTTPPCTEGVNWLVSTQKLAIEPATFAKVRDVIGFNARFPQNKLGETNLLQLSSQSST
ncbi:carbonic anhydrase [Sporothrix schenckii 1099-18]|uniref:carbonic anhydrase n=1 Tax=Sporothrix schenckii 1099-18 TaxID=1397361 RepID=A0A0F2M982_SPOSC|nr:carbonic anhydrase [Sporothrix schenckii 1099-18]KJR86263.1 carbonic anhydrase [Sporothrix schenckii 1099-18]